MAFAESERSSGHGLAQYAPFLPASEAKDFEEQGTLPGLAMESLHSVGTCPAPRTRDVRHSKKACMSCRQKKQRCEDGRPCHRCINSLRTCIDEYMEKRNRRRLTARP
eukprot:762914-Hanusia_phi.AAC.2